MKYPLIQKYMSELKVFSSVTDKNNDLYTIQLHQDCILASDLEAVLAKGQILHGCKRNKQGKDNWAWDNNYTDDTTTHTCLAIGIKPIKSQEPVNIKELLEAVYGVLVLKGQGYDYLEKIAKRIEKNGIKND